MLHKALRSLKSRLLPQRLPEAARLQRKLDRAGLKVADETAPAINVDAALQWLCRAQDFSTGGDGGVARDFSLISGWASSYPETTGYIVPTFLEQAQLRGSDDLRARARRMLDWLISIQLPSGGFQGGTIGMQPVVPVVFNTGQILMGLSAGEKAFGTYRESLVRAADWLVQIQDADGCWRQGASPFALQGDKTYDLHVAWGLMEAARLVPDRGYGEAAMANVRWGMTMQTANGWMDRCCLFDPTQPLAHTLGYALRGLVEGYLYSRDPAVLDAARRLADGLVGQLRQDGFLPGRLGADWSARAEWACLTGSAQIAHCWLQLYRETGEKRYLEGAQRANCYVGRTMRLDVSVDARGAVPGSFPIDGDYCSYQYPNWATKFMVDSLTLQQKIEASGA